MFDLHDIDYHLFDYLSDAQNKLAITKFLQALRSTGLRETDPRLKESMQKLTNVQSEISDLDAVQSIYIDRETFRECIGDNIILIAKAFRNQFIIPEFQQFTQRIDELFWRAKANTAGELASYIPQLARFNPESWGLAICTVDGQRYALGDAFDPICLQSVSKPLTYAMVLDELGPEVVHQYVGQEPSGQAFNTIGLDPMNRPHNPMVNAGAVVTCSLLKQGMNLADKFDFNQQKTKQLAGNEYVSFNNSVFLSERQTADRNFAIGYYMKEKQCFPKGTNLKETLDFYFQLCSVETTCDSASVIAATLANGGICPVTGLKVLEPYCIRDTLSLMLSCGMYDYSGQFAFKVGLPGKSGVSGGIMLVVPNVMGMFMWSPPLDGYGNSVRGIQFCEDLVRTFNFHNYDNLRHTPRKLDPRVLQVDTQANMVVNLLFSAFNGDVTAIRRCALMGMDMSHADYDGRTALHVAAAEGHTGVVEFLLDKCRCSPFLVDRWGFMPVDDAKRFHHHDTAKILESFMEKEKPLETCSKDDL
ncbi:glutaminase kidney isoform, mitochondrial [Aplysia californica]|uniref:glutaminase n=1 Tax=Aplysia californica TaxID=6500 RepID=A0ABM1A538_APLCA|nr:glutaminase kidney isoform, mitochondrial [Aplysia californica]